MQNFTSLLLARVTLAFFIAFITLRGELTAQCDPPNLLPTPTCGAAPFPVCLEDACYSTGQPTSDPHNGWCGANTAIHNAQYFLFQATATSVSIQIHVNMCAGGGCGLQSAILDACEWDNSNVVSCDPGTNVGGTMVLQSMNMEVDSFYWLVIDGCGGQVCEYTIDYVEGVFSPVITEELSNAYTNDPVVCQGQDEWTAVAVNTIQYAAGYLWSGFPWGNGFHTSTFNDMSGPNDPLAIPENAPPGVYEICVVAFNGCDTTDIEQCFDLEIIEIDDEQSDPVTLCPEEYDLGIPWGIMTITSPGSYNQTFNTPEGCPYDSLKEFMAFPEPDEGVIDTVVCESSYTYEGVEYLNAGSYDLFYDDQSVNGCDSTAVLNLDLIFIEAETDFFCEFTQFTLTSQLIQAIPGQAGVTYEWFHNGIYVSQDPTFTTFEPGSYELFVSYAINGEVCTFAATTNPLVIDLASLVPPAPVFDEISFNACALDFPVYSVEEEGDVNSWEWTVPMGATLFNNGEHEVEVSWAGSTGGLVCVHAINDCGAGPDTCFMVEVIASALADFTMPLETCVDEAVTIEFNGQASDNATFLWNFGGAMIISGGTGEGPHMVSWPTSGFKTVTLQVIEPGCDTADIDYDIFVEILGAPVVSCNSTVNSITFEWSPVNGASGYSVTVLSGPTGTLTDTTYVITGLTPGTTVQIQVFAQGVGACAETSVIVDCIAQSCPPKDIVILLPSDSLCLGDVTSPIPLTATVDGVLSVGVWSGPGVDPTGTFDPNDPAAGAGMHQIVFAFPDGTCNYNAQATINVFETPTATFTVDMAICMDSDASVTYTGNASLNADFIWDFGTATVVGGSGAGPYALEWNTAGNYPISLTVVENNCTSQIFTQSVEVQATLSAPVIQCFPTTSSVTLQWSTVPNATTYDVTQLFGSSGTVIGNQFVVNGLVPGDSVSIEVTVSNGGLCPPVTVQASCVAQNCPTPDIQIAPIDDICLYPGTPPVDLEVTITNGSGTGFWSGTGIVDPAEGIFDPLGSGDGEHDVHYNYSEAGCSFVEIITIYVYEPPIADISNTDLVLTCDNDNELVLDGSNSTSPGPIAYLWSTTTGMLQPPFDQPVVTAEAPGLYELMITDLTSGCIDVVSVNLIQDDGVPVADAGADGKIDCNIDFVILGGNSSSGPSIEYLWSSDDGGQIASDPTAPTITVTSGGTYELMVSDVANGCESVDRVVVSVDTLQPSAVLSSGDILDCDTKTTTVSAVVSPGGSTFSYSWTTTGGVIISGNGTDEITVDRPGTYTLNLTSLENGCEDQVSVVVIGDDDIISGTLSNVDNPDCVGDVNGQISVESVLGGNAPFDYTWSTGESTSVISNLAPGNYSVTISDQNGCSLVESYSLPAPVAINPDIGTNLLYNINESVSITLTVTDPGSVSDVIWGGVAPACGGCLQIEFPAAMSGQVMVTVIDTNGCEASASLVLTVLRPRNIFIPTVFSPNGDNVNDRFTIKGNTLVEIKALRIFDRWGGLVYETLNILPNTTDGWDGTFNGKQLSPGVFVYMAEVVHDDGLAEVLKGDITLIR